MLVLLLAQCWNRLNGPRTTLFLRPTFAQHPFNFCWTNVGQMLKPFKGPTVVWKPDLNWQRFWRFQLFIFPVFNKQFEKLYQALSGSQTPRRRWKKKPQQRYVFSTITRCLEILIKKLFPKFVISHTSQGKLKRVVEITKNDTIPVYNLFGAANCNMPLF